MSDKHVTHTEVLDCLRFVRTHLYAAQARASPGDDTIITRHVYDAYRRVSDVCREIEINGIGSELDRAWAEVDKLVKQLGDLATLRKQDELVHGNIMGRIAVNLFGNQNNVTDEECVAETARIGYMQTALMQRLKGLEEELHVWKERYQWMLEWAAQLKAYEPPAPIVVDANSPMLGVLRGAKDAGD